MEAKNNPTENDQDRLMPKMAARRRKASQAAADRYYAGVRAHREAADAALKEAQSLIADLTFDLNQNRPMPGETPSLTFLAILDRLVEVTATARRS